MMEHTNPTHKMTGVVKELDPAKGRVTLAYGPVKSLNWPAGTTSHCEKSYPVRQPGMLGKITVVRK